MKTELDYQKLAEQAVKETADTPDFAYSGDTPIGETWAFTFSQHRDSNNLQKSNFKVISEDLLERFPDDVKIESFNHWAVGWIEQLEVRMLDEKGIVTAAGKASLDWNVKLSDYCVADEDDYSRMDYEDSLGHISFTIGDDDAKEVFSRMFDLNMETNPEEISDDDIIKAHKDLFPEKYKDEE